MRKCLFRFSYSILLVTFGLLATMIARGADVSADFNRANHLYEQQKFSEAANAYEALLKAGNRSAPLFFNLGTAYFKAGELGQAIAAYLKAERLEPRDPDIKANLQFARDQVQNTKPPPTSLWSQLLDRFTLNEWTVFSAAFLWMFFLLLAVGQLRKEWRKLVRSISLPIAVITLALIACTASAAVRHSQKRAVVISNNAVVRRGPFDESQSAYSLGDGGELSVLDRKDNWIQVSDSGNRIGWIPSNQVAIVD